jgi:DNA-binding response OmpR family regulator
MRRTSTARVLVVEDVELEAKLVIRALADAGYSNVAHATDMVSALDKIARNDIRLVITDLGLSGTAGSGVDLTRILRGRQQSSYIYVIALTSSGGERQMLECFDAGVDDFMRKPFERLELVSRLRAGERIVELERRLSRKGNELERALRRIDVAAAQRALARAAEPTELTVAPGATPLQSLAATTSWRDLEPLLAKVTGEFFQLPFSSVPIRADIAAPFIAEISLSEPTKQLEMGLAAVVDVPTMSALSMHVLGENDQESSQALILELANVLMGALKPAFATHGFAFTGSLPSEGSLDESKKVFDASTTRARLAVGSGDWKLELWLRVAEKKNEVVKGRMLREGLVICQDLHDARGMLLIRSGSRLTKTAVERLALLAPDLDVEVTNPSA